MNDLLNDISQFCQQAGIAETTFGRLAVNDGKLVRRLRNGGVPREKTRERISRYIEARTGQNEAGSPSAD
jgi:hypothetical protein